MDLVASSLACGIMTITMFSEVVMKKKGVDISNSGIPSTRVQFNENIFEKNNLAVTLVSSAGDKKNTKSDNNKNEEDPKALFRAKILEQDLEIEKIVDEFKRQFEEVSNSVPKSDESIIDDLMSFQMIIRNLLDPRESVSGIDKEQILGELVSSIADTLIKLLGMSPGNAIYAEIMGIVLTMDSDRKEGLLSLLKFIREKLERDKDAAAFMHDRLMSMLGELSIDSVLQIYDRLLSLSSSYGVDLVKADNLNILNSAKGPAANRGGIDSLNILLALIKMYILMNSVANGIGAFGQLNNNLANISKVTPRDILDVSNVTNLRGSDSYEKSIEKSRLSELLANAYMIDKGVNKQSIISSAALDAEKDQVRQMMLHLSAERKQMEEAFKKILRLAMIEQADRNQSQRMSNVKVFDVVNFGKAAAAIEGIKDKIVNMLSMIKGSIDRVLSHKVVIASAAMHGTQRMNYGHYKAHCGGVFHSADLAHSYNDSHKRDHGSHFVRHHHHNHVHHHSHNHVHHHSIHFESHDFFEMSFSHSASGSHFFEVSSSAHFVSMNYQGVSINEGNITTRNVNKIGFAYEGTIRSAVMGAPFSVDDALGVEKGGANQRQPAATLAAANASAVAVEANQSVHQCGGGCCGKR